MFHGSIVALVTPMDESGVIDIEALRQLVEWQIEQKTDGIVISGSTGESATLDYTERKNILQIAIDQAKGRIPIIAGTGTSATAFTIELTKTAMELGADACLLVTPYYNKPTQEGLYQHFKAVAEAVSIPQILYNVPARTGCDLQPTTVARLAALPNIIAIKEATGDLTRVQKILRLTQAHELDLFSGDDSSCLDFILLGGRGVISVTANVAPKAMHDLCQAALSRDIISAVAINDRLTNLHLKMCIESNPIPVKWALQQMNKIPTGIRLPLMPLSADYHASVRAAMIEAGVS